MSSLPPIPLDEVTPYDVTAEDISREAHRFGLSITSGRRTPQRNQAVGGVPNSFHLRGQAYDLAGTPEAMQRFYSHIKSRYGANLSEVIDEKDHIHVAGFKSQKPIPLTDVTPIDQPTARDEAIMRDTGLPLTAAQKFKATREAKRLTSLPPDVPTAAAPIDQIAAQYEVLKGGGFMGLTNVDLDRFTEPLRAAGWEVGPDYIKPPAGTERNFPLWRHQLGGQESRAAEEARPKAWYERTATGRNVRALFEPVGGMIEQAGKTGIAAVTGKAQEAAKGTYELTLKPQVDQFQRAYELYQQRRPSPAAMSNPQDQEIFGHALAGLVPFLGPVAASFGEKTGTGVGKLTQGDKRGWEDLIAAVPDAAMLAAPLISKGFKAMERGVPAEKAMADIAPELKQLIGAKLKEPIEVQGAPATGAKPKVVLPREEAANARQTPPIQREAGPTGEARSAVDAEVPPVDVASKGEVGGVRDSQQAEVVKAEVANEPQRVSRPVRSEPVASPEAQAGKGPIAEAGSTAEGQPAKGQRSLPQTLGEAGLERGTDLTYDIAANPATVEKARQNIADKGVEGAAEFVRSAESPTAEHTATGFAVIRELQDAGKFAEAADVASDLSARLTTSGQAIQAVKTIAQFAPERAAVVAQRVLDQAGKGKKLSPIQSERITKAAKGIEAATETVGKAELRLDDLTAKLPATSPANWRAKLTAAETAARERIAARGPRESLVSGETGTFDPTAIGDYAIIGAAKLARKGIDFATWAKEMTAEFGDTIKPHLARIYRASFEQYSSAKRDAYQAMKERAVQKGLPPMTATELATAVHQRDLAIKMRTAATRGLATEYERLQPGRRFKREVVSVLNLPRALKSSLDLSAPLRQGAIFAASEFKASSKAFGAQLRALTERGFEKVYADIQRNPAYAESQASGLELTGSPLRGHGLSAAEEAFMTKWAEKIPGIKQSNQAYSAYLDTLRMNVFEKYAAQIREAVPDAKMQAAELKHIASFINKATGRGDLGRSGNAMAPVLNAAFFSPRYAVSRLQVLNPATYMKMTPFARKVALKKMFAFTGMVGTTLALAKAGGMDVSTDPTAADFLKIKAGDTRFDILAGMQQWMRFGSRLAAGFYKSSQGESMKEQEKPVNVVTSFVRSKASPPASVVWDYATGRTFEGEQPTLKGELRDQFIPLFLADAQETWASTNTPEAAKVAATAAGFFGVGTQTYSPRAKKSTSDQQQSLLEMIRGRKKRRQ